MNSNKSENKITDFHLYWIKIIITIVFGIFSYYLLEFILPNWNFVMDLPYLNVLRNIMFVFGCWFFCLIGIPFFILILINDYGFWASFKRSFKTFGTQFLIYITLSSIIYFVNIW